MITTLPRLTEDLPGNRHPNECQSCGFVSEDRIELTRWLEHDEHDQPEPRVVVLCRPCSERLIAAHPRLYRELHPLEPMIGVMELCLDCRHRAGTSCTNHLAKVNGGPGLSVIFPKPQSVHLCRTGGRSGWHHNWQGPPTSCAGREFQDRSNQP